MIVREPVPLRCEESKPASASKESISAAGEVSVSVAATVPVGNEEVAVIEKESFQGENDDGEDEDYDDYLSSSEYEEEGDENIRQMLRDSLHRTQMHSLNKPL